MGGLGEISVEESESAADAEIPKADTEYCFNGEIKKSEWDLKVHTVIDCQCSGSKSDSIGAIEFNPTNDWLATGGLARKIRLYNFNSLINLLSEEENDIRNHQTVKIGGGSYDGERKIGCFNENPCTESVICTPAKLSSLKWDPMHGEGVIASGDYDGVVTEWDVEKAFAIFERDEHGGRKVWSVDYSLLYHSLCASASDDGTVQMWDKNCNRTLMVLSAPSRKPVCCAEFSPSNGNLVAMACSDHGVYVYDMRRVSSPSSSSSSALFALHDHNKPASYVRFFRENMVVSAAIDGSIKLWDISHSMAEAALPVRSYRGHCNKKNFVGLSVWEEGSLFACGSESNEVFAYDYKWGTPLWTCKFNSNNGRGVGTFSDDGGGDSLLTEGREISRRMDLGFVSGVCWRQKPSECTLVAANSYGVLQVIIGNRRSQRGNG